MSSLGININYGNEAASFNNIQTTVQKQSENSTKNIQEQKTMSMEDTVTFSSEAISKSGNLLADYKKAKAEEVYTEKSNKLVNDIIESIENPMNANGGIAIKPKSTMESSGDEAGAEAEEDPVDDFTNQQLEDLAMQMKELQAEIQKLAGNQSEAAQMKIKALQQELGVLQSLHAALSEKKEKI